MQNENMKPLVQNLISRQQWQSISPSVGHFQACVPVRLHVACSGPSTLWGGNPMFLISCQQLNYEWTTWPRRTKLHDSQGTGLYQHFPSTVWKMVEKCWFKYSQTSFYWKFIRAFNTLICIMHFQEVKYNIQHFSKIFLMGSRQFQTQARIRMRSQSVNGLTCSRAEFQPQLLTHVSKISLAGWPAFLQPALGQWVCIAQGPMQMLQVILMLNQCLSSSPLLREPGLVQG